MLARWFSRESTQQFIKGEVVERRAVVLYGVHVFGKDSVRRRWWCLIILGDG